MNIKVFKLTTGEEIIGELTHVEANMFHIDGPLGIGIDHQQGRLVFVPFMPYTNASESIVLHADSLVMQPVDPLPQIADDYGRATSRIVTPPKSLIRPV